VAGVLGITEVGDGVVGRVWVDLDLERVGGRAKVEVAVQGLRRPGRGRAAVHLRRGRLPAVAGAGRVQRRGADADEAAGRHVAAGVEVEAARRRHLVAQHGGRAAGGRAIDGRRGEGGRADRGGSEYLEAER